MKSRCFEKGTCALRQIRVVWHTCSLPPKEKQCLPMSVLMVAVVCPAAASWDVYRTVLLKHWVYPWCFTEIAVFLYVFVHFTFGQVHSIEMLGMVWFYQPATRIYVGSPRSVPSPPGSHWFTTFHNHSQLASSSFGTEIGRGRWSKSWSAEHQPRNVGCSVESCII